MKSALLAIALAGGLAAAGTVCAQAPQAPRVVAASEGAASPALTGEIDLSPRQLAQLVALRSPEIRYSRMAVDVAAHLSAAEAALYETVFYSSLQAADGKRQRTVEERLAGAATQSVLDEYSRTLEAGLRQRLATGGEATVSWRQVRRSNNIIASSTNDQQDTEWTSGLVISLKQPLLRGAGRSVTETDRRVAELEQQVQWAQFRQQVLKSTAEALNNYWQLRRAQQAVALRDDSLANARRMAQDVQDRIDAGRAAASGLLEVRSVVATREADAIRAEQAAREAETKLMTALGLSAAHHPGLRFKALPGKLPTTKDVEVVDRAIDRALAQWPPYLVSRLHLQEGRLRLQYARDQQRPKLDLSASYEANGLAYDRIGTSRLISHDKYPEWNIGLNLEVPLDGNGRAGGQYQAQVTRVSQNELELEAIRTSLANDLAQRRDELLADLRLVDQVKEDLALREKVLEAERDRYHLGMGLLSQWLQRENEVYEARQRLAEAMMRAHLAQVAWHFAQGSLLDEYDIALRNE